MNYGNASDYENNGELIALQKAAQVLKSCPDQLVIFDVGANVGHYTQLITQAFRSQDHILYAFEPSHFTFLKLKQNIGQSNKMHLHQLAMSNQPGETWLYYEKEGSGLSSFYQRDLGHRQIEMKTRERIPVSTLDLFCQEHQLDHIHFLKMDVEGHELSVLKGAETLLQKQGISVIQFEFGGCNIDSRTYFRDFYKLLSDKFRLYRILKDGVQPINQYHERLEIYISANYLAVRKDLPAL